MGFNAGSLVRSRSTALVAVFIMATGAMLPAFAVDVPTLFSAEVPLDDESDNPRNDAYKAALVEVLTRVSGTALGTNAQAIDDMFPVPSAYVTQFRPGEEDHLWVSFDGEAIEQVLRTNGQIVWGSDRPLTLVWLAVDWGQGEREIVAAGDPERLAQEARSIDRNRLLRERLLDIAQKRGLPIAFPLLDTTDLQSVTFSDIWGGFDERIIDASTRYDADSVLIGKIRPSSGQANRWTYVFGKEKLSWSGAPDVVVAQIADLLAAEFSVGGNAPIERVALNVSGVESVDAYGSVQKLLSDVSLIEQYRVAMVSGDVISFEVDVRGGAERLRRALRFTDLIEQSDGAFDPLNSNGALDFFYESPSFGPQETVNEVSNVP